MCRYLLAWGGWRRATDSGCGLLVQILVLENHSLHGGGPLEEAVEEEQWGLCRCGVDGGLVAGT